MSGLPEPYFKTELGKLYCCDCLEILPQLGPVDLVITDPPYGINYRSNHNSSRRGKWAKWVRNENLPGIIGDDKPFNPDPWMGIGRVHAFFGANYCSDRLPPTRCWIVWNKRDGIGQNNQADCELVWTDFDRVSRIFNHLWSGLLRAGDENVALQPKYHPHQKPLALLKYIIEYSGTTGPVVDPYCGSGSTCVACEQLGIEWVGVEISEKYCDETAKRIERERQQLKMFPPETEPKKPIQEELF